jgi:hypothetical protein
MTAAALPANQRPHPVVFDVEYPERLSRGLIFVKWLLLIPHFIVVYLLSLVLFLVTIFAWFAILFTGRYPKGIFELSSGTLRWMSNVFAYFGLMRDEYPPFSLETGQYAVLLDIPRAERQSRFRLFIRFFAAIPNYIVLYFLQIASFVTTFIAWWAILFTGRYPRGLFRFSTGVMRWYNRLSAYFYCLRDEFPPYSINANARPGNEVVSTIIGAPIGIAYIGLYAWFSLAPLIDGGDTVEVDRAVLESGGIATLEPSGSAGGLRITITDFDDDVRTDAGPGFSFDVRAEHDGWLPAAYFAFTFAADDCGSGPPSGTVYEVDGDWFRIFPFGDTAESTIIFEGSGASVCALEYFTGTGNIRFEFE